MTNPCPANELLLSQPDQFMSIVLTDDVEARVNQLHTLDDLVVCEALRYGITNNPDDQRSLAQLYTEYFLKASTKTRLEIYDHLARIVPELGGHTVGAYTPFMLLDPDPIITSRSVLDYCSSGTLLNADPMTRPRDVVAMLRPDYGPKGFPANRGAMFGGLLLLGDQRVCELITDMRDTLSIEELEQMTGRYSGFLSDAVLGFYLTWLEELVVSEDYADLSRFGHLAAGLYRQIEQSRTPLVFEGKRPFPVPDNGKDWPEVSRITLEKYVTDHSDRLFALEAQESVPKVMPHVLKTFGLVPRTSAEETAEY